MDSIKDKVALITGGTSGIGRATALEFARRGAHVVLTGRREPEGQAVAAAVRELGVQARFVRGDVSRESDVERFVAEAAQLTGRIDFAFNNAGVEEAPGPFLEKNPSVFDEVFNPNVRGVFLSLKHEIAAMLKTGGGAIVNTASIAGIVGFAGVPIYVASKHAVIGLTRAVALEFASRGIRVNSVLPAAIETPMLDRFTGGVGTEFHTQLARMHPIGRVGRPEEIARAVVWMCSGDASFMTGQNLVLDGGFTAQ